MSWLCALSSLAILSFFLCAYFTARVLIRPVPPSPADSPERYGLPYEPVQFHSRDGLRLDGWWIPAPQLTKRTVVICHGREGSRERELPHAQTLHAAGFNVLMFDFRAHGRSEGQHVTFGMYEKDDLLGALDFLAERGILQVGVLGFSLGATTAIIAAAISDRIAAIVAEGTVVRLKRTLARRLRRYSVPFPLGWLLAAWALALAAAITRGRMDQTDAIRWIEHIRAPILLIHGTHDDLISATEITELAARCSSQVVVWQVEGAAHHQAAQVASEAFRQRMVAWFDQYLSREA